MSEDIDFTPDLFDDNRPDAVERLEALQLKSSRDPGGESADRPSNLPVSPTRLRQTSRLSKPGGVSLPLELPSTVGVSRTLARPWAGKTPGEMTPEELSAKWDWDDMVDKLIQTRIANDKYLNSIEDSNRQRASELEVARGTESLPNSLAEIMGTRDLSQVNIDDLTRNQKIELLYHGRRHRNPRFSPDVQAFLTTTAPNWLKDMRSGWVVGDARWQMKTSGGRDLARKRFGPVLNFRGFATPLFSTVLGLDPPPPVLDDPKLTGILDQLKDAGTMHRLDGDGLLLETTRTIADSGPMMLELGKLMFAHKAVKQVARLAGGKKISAGIVFVDTLGVINAAADYFFGEQIDEIARANPGFDPYGSSPETMKVLYGARAAAYASAAVESASFMLEVGALFRVSGINPPSFFTNAITKAIATPVVAKASRTALGHVAASQPVRAGTGLLYNASGEYVEEALQHIASEMAVEYSRHIFEQASVFDALTAAGSPAFLATIMPGAHVAGKGGFAAGLLMAGGFGSAGRGLKMLLPSGSPNLRRIVGQQMSRKRLDDLQAEVAKDEGQVSDAVDVDEKIYISIDELDLLPQETVEQLKAALGEDFADDVVRGHAGATVAIATRDLVEKLMPQQDLYDAMAPIIRHEVDGMSEVEALAYISEFGDEESAKIREKANAIVRQNVGAAGIVDEIFADLREVLGDNVTDEQLRNGVALDANLIAAVAIQEGIDPVEYYRSKNFTIDSLDGKNVVMVPQQKVIHVTGAREEFESFSFDFNRTGQGFNSFFYGMYFTKDTGIQRNYIREFGRRLGQEFNLDALTFRGARISTNYQALLKEAEAAWWNLQDDPDNVDLQSALDDRRELAIAGYMASLIRDQDIGTIAGIKSGINQVILDISHYGRMEGIYPSREGDSELIGRSYPGSLLGLFEEAIDERKAAFDALLKSALALENGTAFAVPRDRPTEIGARSGPGDIKWLGEEIGPIIEAVAAAEELIAKRRRGASTKAGRAKNSVEARLARRRAVVSLLMTEHLGQTLHDRVDGAIDEIDKAESEVNYALGLFQYTDEGFDEAMEERLSSAAVGVLRLYDMDIDSLKAEMHGVLSDLDDFQGFPPKPKGPQVLTVGIPDDEELIAWDADLVDQSDYIKGKLEDGGFVPMTLLSELSGLHKEMSQLLDSPEHADGFGAQRNKINADISVVTDSINEYRKANKTFSDIVELSGNASITIATWSGEDLLKKLADLNESGFDSDGVQFNSPRDKRIDAERLVSVDMNEAGIHGQRFLIGPHRRRGVQDNSKYNYVVWNEESMEILDRVYGDVVLLEQVLRSPAFTAWFNQSKIVDENGEPVVLYHGTLSEFDSFDLAQLSVEAFLGQTVHMSTDSEDAGRNYANEMGADQRNRLEQTVDRIEDEDTEEATLAEANRILNRAHQGAIIPMIVSIQNPLVAGPPVGDIATPETMIEFEIKIPQEFIDQAEEEGEDAFELAMDSGIEEEYAGEGGRLIEAIQEVAQEFEDIDEDAMHVAVSGELTAQGGVSGSELLMVLMNIGIDATDPFTGELAQGEFVRTVLERAGFDGVVDNLASSRFPGMNIQGSHVMAFRPNQVKSPHNLQPTQSDDLLFQFGGAQSQTADKKMLARALVLESKGKGMVAISKATGWFRNKNDGKWRYVIDSRGAKVSFSKMLKFSAFQVKKDIQHKAVTRLGKILDYPEIFKAYPSLSNVKVELVARHKDSNEAMRGFHLPPDGKGQHEVIRVYVSPESRKAGTLTKGETSILIHEIQHAVQSRERFAGGSNTSTVTAKTQVTVQRQAMLRTLGDWIQAVPSVKKTYDALEAAHPDPGTAGVSVSERNAAITGREQSPEMVKFGEALGNANFVTEITRVVAEIAQRFDLNTRDGIYELYRTSAGEIEARLAQELFENGNGELAIALITMSAIVGDTYAHADYTSGLTFSREAKGHPARVGQGLPTNAGKTHNGMDRTLRADKATADQSPVDKKTGLTLAQRQVRRVLAWPGIKPPPSRVKTHDQGYRHIVNTMKANLKALHDLMPPEIRDRARQWYDGGNKVVRSWARAYGLADEQVAAIIAVLSPTKDWYQNVGLANRMLDIMTDNRETETDESMIAWGEVAIPREAELLSARTGEPVNSRTLKRNLEMLHELRGKKLKDLPTSRHKAIWIRAYDEMHNDLGFRMLSPEGDMLGFATHNGRPDSLQKHAHQSFGAMAKAVRVFEDGSGPSINWALGAGHKVRNFYDNLLDPNALMGDLTADTHAVGGALFRPIGAQDAEAGDTFGFGSDGDTGIRGVYWIVAEAYREAAADLGLLPRELQSITWEAARLVFPDHAKNKKRKWRGQFDAVTADYDAGKISAPEMRRRVLAISKESYGEKFNGDIIQRPDWAVSDARPDANARGSTYPGGVPREGVSAVRGGVGLRAGGRVAGRLPAIPSGTTALDTAARPAVSAGLSTAIQSIRSELRRRNRGRNAETQSRPFGGRDQGLSGIVWTLRKEFRDTLNAEGSTTPKWIELSKQGKLKTENAEKFHAAMVRFKANPVNKFHASVLLKDVASYKGMRLFMNKDETAGFAITPQGEGVSVFANGDDASVSRSWPSVITLMVQEGVTKLVSFDVPLPHIYAKGGFFPVSRTLFDETLAGDWDPELYRKYNDGRPDIVYYAYNPNYTDGVYEGEGPMVPTAKEALRIQAASTPGSIDLLFHNPSKPLGGTGIRRDLQGNIKQIFVLFAEGANVSTVLHEFFHVGIELWESMVLSGHGTSQMEADLVRFREFAGTPTDQKTLVDWDGLKAARESGDKKKEAEIRKGIEEIVRAFEAYVRKGKSPTPELTPIFSKMEGWMLGIYRSERDLFLKSGSETLTGIFDRMVAGEDALAAAADDMGLTVPLKISGLTAGDEERYRAAIDRALQAARETYRAEIFREEERKLVHERRDQRAAGKDGIEAELRSSPVQQVRDWLADGRWIGPESEAPLLEPQRLDHRQLAAYDDGNGTDFLGTLPRTIVGGKKKTGLPIEIVASMAGVDIHEFLELMVGRGTLAQEVERRASELAPEPSLSEVGDAVTDALHNDPTGRLLVLEMQFLKEAGSELVGAAETRARDFDAPTLREARDRAAAAREALTAVESSGSPPEGALAEARVELQQAEAALTAARGPVGAEVRRTRQKSAQVARGLRVLQSEARDAAKTAVGRMKLDDMSPDRFSSAERRAADKSRIAVANGDFEAAFAAKRTQLINHYAYRETVAARRERKSAEARAKALKKGPTRKKIAKSEAGQGAESIRSEIAKAQATVDRLARPLTPAEAETLDTRTLYAKEQLDRSPSPDTRVAYANLQLQQSYLDPNMRHEALARSRDTLVQLNEQLQISENPTLGILGVLDTMLAPFAKGKLGTGAILERLRNVEGYESIQTFAARKEERDGYPVAFDPDTVERLSNKPLGQLTLDEMRTLRKAIDNVEQIGRDQAKVKIGGQSIKTGEAAALAASKIRSTAPSHNVDDENYEPDATLKGRVIKRWREGKAFLLKPETFLMQLDGWEAGGFIHKLLMQPFRDAQFLEKQLENADAKELHAAFKAWHGTHADPYTPFGEEYFDAIGESFSREAMVMIALNAGTESNRAALLEGFGNKRKGIPPWTEEQLQHLLDQLTAEDIVLVKEVWRIVNNKWPAIKAHETSMNGYAPAKIEGMEVTMGGETFTGAYTPLVYDFRKSSRSRTETFAENRQVQAIVGTSTNIATQQGFLITRKGSGGRRVQLRFDTIMRHMSDVNHDLAYREAVINALKITGHPLVSDAIGEAYGLEFNDMLRSWIEDNARPSESPLDPIAQFARHSRIAMSVMAMGGKVTTILVQAAGLTTTVQTLGPIRTVHAFASLVGQNGSERYFDGWRFAMNNSKELPFRMTARDLNLFDIQAKILQSSRVTWADNVRVYSFMAAGGLDLLISAATFGAAYSKATEELHMDEQDAIDFADSMIVMTQSSGAQKDLAKIQRSGELMRMLTPFFTYQSQLTSQLYRDWHLSMKSTNNRYAAVGKAVAAQWVRLAAGVIMAEILRGNLGRMLDDEDDEEPDLGTFAQNVTLGVMSDVASQVPVLGTVFDFADRYDFEITSVATAMSSPRRMAKELQDLEFDRMFVRTVFDTVGFFGKMPTNQPKGWTERLIFDVYQNDEDFFDWDTFYGRRERDN